MAYNVGNNAIVEVSIVGQASGQTTLTILHYRLGGAPVETGTDGSAALTALNTVINNQTDSLQVRYMACMAVDFTCTAVRLQWLWPIRYRSQERTPQAAVGTSGGQIVSANIAAAITRGGDLAGRGKSGTLHMPAVPANFMDDSILNADAKTAYDGFGARTATIIAASGGLTFTPVLYNREAPAQSQQVTVAASKNTVRTMRRRTVGRGI